MTELSGYVLETLRDDGELALYRGRRPGEDGSILIRAALADTSSARDQLDREFRLAEDLDPAWAVRPLALTRHADRPALVLEDPGGPLLEALLQLPLDLGRFLELAAALTGAVRKLHDRGLVHKDLNPSNMLLDATGTIRLTGFGVATRLARERQASVAPDFLQGAPAYMAPEQTGRMNRSIDARSDLYSLGVTFFQMLTGALPFSASDATEWIHCHIARDPTPPNDLVAGLPGLVSSIVLKLLAKAPEDRYQTAAGLEADLRRCLADWTRDGRLDPFALAERDRPDQLVIPEKLYGRDPEIQELMAAFVRVRAHGATELMLVSGYPGIGKSSIVNELHKILVLPRGLFAQGKFDQYKRDIPYATLAQAFRGLLAELLGKGDAELDYWRRAITEAVGANARLLVDLLPELSLIIGEPPPVADLPPLGAQSRFQRVFKRFIGVFARPEHPLALFLDDLQWLDAATLQLLESIAIDPAVRHILLLGAYRDNEVGPDHPLTRTLQTIRNAGVSVGRILLSPLAAKDVALLVADALQDRTDRTRSLAELVFAKTAGNPFFAIQFLTALVDGGLLRFDCAGSLWTWDVKRIRSANITDQVVELMTRKLQRLPTSSLKAVKLLACIGDTASCTLMSTLLESHEEDVEAALAESVRAGLVVGGGGEYAFLHDRVREAAYALVPEAERLATHLAIGRWLVSRTSDDEIVENEIVSHLNTGAALIRSEAERDQARKLNMIAGLRAKSSTAYASAINYLTAASQFLPAEPWEEHYQASFQLQLHMADCEFLTGGVAAAEDRLSTLSRRAANAVDLAAVTCRQVAVCTALDRPEAAVRVGIEYLERSGVEWPQSPGEEDVRAELAQLWRRLGARTPDALLDLPRMSDPAWRGTMDVLAEMIPPALFTDSNLHSLIICRMVNLSLQHGNAESSCHAYVWFGMLLGPRFGDFERGAQFGEAGCELADRPPPSRFITRAYLGLANIIPWVRHLHSGLVLFRRAVDAAQETGDLTFAGYSRGGVVTHLLALGEPLGAVAIEAEAALSFARGAGFGIVATVIGAQLSLIRTLAGETKFGSLNHGDFHEDACEAMLEANPQFVYASWRYWIRKLQARCFAGDYATAALAAAKAEQLLSRSPSLAIYIELIEYHLFAAIACARAPDTDPKRLEGLLAHERQFRLWRVQCPKNFRHCEALLGAEIARLEHRDLDAMRLYEEAIQWSRDDGFVQREALACELAAQFYRDRGFATIAGLYYRNARACYGRWGAVGKVRQLDDAFPNFLPASAGPDSPSGAPPAPLDLATVIRQSQAVSSEIDLSKLIQTLMVIAIEQAGAERVVLFLPHDGELRAEAEAVADRDRLDVHLHSAAIPPAEAPDSLIQYVVRRKESVLLDDASARGAFAGDDYIKRRRSQSILALPLMKQAHLAGVLYFENNQTTSAFTPARIAVLNLLASQAAISLENARLYTGLRNTEAHLAEAQRLSRIGSFVFAPARGKIVWSEGMFRIYEFALDMKLTLESGLLRTLPGEPSLSQKIIERVPPDGADVDLHHRLMMPDGTVKYLHAVVHTETDENGDSQFVGSVMDITPSVQNQMRLQAALKEKDALLKEVHHRVKNNLQLISSLLNLQAAGIEDKAISERFADSRNRVRSMALVHENLYRAGNFSRIPMKDHVQGLCAQLVRAYAPYGPQVALVTEIEDIDLGLDQAISAGLIVNELVSNAFKHAFPDGRQGTVWVGLKRIDERTYALDVADDGVGLPSDHSIETARSLGLQLVRDLTDQLHGALRLDRNQGTLFSCQFTASEASR